MTILTILQYPDKRLRRIAKPVTNVDDTSVQQLINAMFETMRKTPHCAGLSSTQLEVEIPWKITVIDESRDNDQPYCLINPEIITREGESLYSEGCMSVYPDYIHAEVKRADRITFKALDQNGEPLEIAANGIFSICVQHELDHLDGVLYIDHLSMLKRRMIDKKITKIHRQIEDNSK